MGFMRGDCQAPKHDGPAAVNNRIGPGCRTTSAVLLPSHQSRRARPQGTAAVKLHELGRLSAGAAPERASSAASTSSRVKTDVSRFMVRSYCATACVSSLVSVPGPLAPDRQVEDHPKQISHKPCQVSFSRDRSIPHSGAPPRHTSIARPAALGGHTRVNHGTRPANQIRSRRCHRRVACVADLSSSTPACKARRLRPDGAG